jgi:hypothetical protein
MSDVPNDPRRDDDDDDPTPLKPPDFGDGGEGGDD